MGIRETEILVQAILGVNIDQIINQWGIQSI